MSLWHLFPDNRYYEKIGKNEPVDITDELATLEIPNEWIWVRFSHIFEIQTGASFKKEEAKKECFDNSIRILRGGNIRPFMYDLKPDDLYIMKDLNEFNNNLQCNTLITPAVTNIENIGKIARIDKLLINTNVGGFVYKVSWI